MDRLRDDFLAGAVFAENKHGQIGVGHSLGNGSQATMAGLSPIRRTRSAACWAIWRLAARSCCRSRAFSEGHGGEAGPVRPVGLVFKGECAGKFIDEFERAEQLAGGSAKRHAQQRTGLIAQLGVDVAVDQGGFEDRVDAARASGLNDLADHAAMVGNSQLAIFHAQSRPTDEGMGAAVPKKMLARSAASSRVAASAIWTSRRSTLLVRPHCLASSRMALRRSMRRVPAALRRTQSCRRERSGQDA